MGKAESKEVVADPPTTLRDQLIAVNFLCVNVACLEAVQLVVAIFDYDVSRDDVEHIWNKQHEQEARNGNDD